MWGSTTKLSQIQGLVQLSFKHGRLTIAVGINRVSADTSSLRRKPPDSAILVEQIDAGCAVL